MQLSYLYIYKMNVCLALLELMFYAIINQTSDRHENLSELPQFFLFYV